MSKWMNMPVEITKTVTSVGNQFISRFPQL